MKLLSWFAIFALSLLAVSAPAQTAKPPERQVAITIDDLPAGNNTLTPAQITEMTTKLLTTLRDQKVPVVGFVNEKKLYHWGETDERIKVLRMWLDYGNELGNHTYSHSSLNRVGLAAWEDDIVQGENVTSLLMGERKMKLRYFRHPYLDTGRDLETRRKAEEFLINRGYRIAPITLDAWDWMFAGVYEDAKKAGDAALQKRVVESYLQYSDAMFGYFEELSKQTVGYEPKQILLLHANQLESEHIGELLDLLRKRGYRFVTLEDALGDGAYSLPDMFVAEYGSGWIEHWAITQGKPPRGEPEIPKWAYDMWKARPPQPNY
jgi:peptidoglycan/xylan/chitin deacetylase (PgdA/CDA1 family)